MQENDVKMNNIRHQIEGAKRLKAQIIEATTEAARISLFERFIVLVNNANKALTEFQKSLIQSDILFSGSYYKVFSTEALWRYGF